MITRRNAFIMSVTGLAVTAISSPLTAGHRRLGMFTGTNGHVTTGTAELIESSNGNSVNLLNDFTFDGAPDPKVALGKDGAYDPKTLSGTLKANTGASSYQLPDGIDPHDYNEVWIWCQTFGVPLGVAKIS